MDKINVVKNKMSREQMLYWIDALSFCSDDMKLYLDTHPYDKNALEYYNQCVELVASAKKAYEDVYGPLSLSCNLKFEEWDWNKNDMPWERGNN